MKLTIIAALALSAFAADAPPKAPEPLKAEDRATLYEAMWRWERASQSAREAEQALRQNFERIKAQYKAGAWELGDKLQWIAPPEKPADPAPSAKK